jgi:hypothetical protein
LKKNVFAALAISLGIGLVSCSSDTKTESQEGVYSMDKASMTDGKTETTSSSSDGGFQYKIFTPSHYFYIAIAKDSSGGFGLGTYTKNGKNLEENNIYNTIGLDTASVAKLEISSTEKGYIQLIPELVIRGVKYKLNEEYTKVQSTGTSDLDGVWKQTKNLVVTAKDTADKTYHEYKVYQAGHFMWATRFLADSTKKEFKNAVGHGTFKLEKAALTEQLEHSNMSGVLGKYDIKIVFNGKDEYTQETADAVNKSVGFKTYTRVK